MAQSRRSKRKETVVAQVYLRSISGRSFREFAENPLPSDLSPFRAPPAARDEVWRTFEKLGFKVYQDEMGLALSVEATPGVFAKVFGVSADKVTKVLAKDTIRLRAPKDIQHLVGEILITPKPEFFSGA